MRTLALALALLVLAAPTALAQPHDSLATQVDQMPEIVGGVASIVDRVAYPPEAKAEGVEGRVVVAFVVDEEGAVEDAEVVSGADPRLDAAALAAVRATTFRPGLRDGHPVRVQMALPILFELPHPDDGGAPR